MNPRLLAQILRYRRKLRSRDQWNRRQIEVHQAGWLRELRDFANAHSRFYQLLHRGLDARPLHELPIVTKAMLMEAFNELVTVPTVRREAVESYVRAMQSADRFQGKYFVASTSGSTGLRGLFVWDESEWATVMASYARAQDWAGVPAQLTRRTRMAVVSSRTPWHQSAVVGATAHSPFIPTLRLDATDPIESVVAELDRFQPEILVGYASMARVLADEQLAGRLHISPKAVMSASEVLSDEARRHIAAAFGKPPFNVYAATETAGVASECREHRLHLYEDLVITEVVDDQNRPVPPGEFGAKVLVTVLFSRTMPLIRYEMSDCLRVSSEVCKCGRAFALIDGIEGRREDVLDLPSSADGKVRIHPNVFHDILDAAPLRAWQVVEEPDGLRVLVQGLAAGAEPKALEGRIDQALTAHGAAARRVTVERVDEIRRTAVGKAPLVQRLKRPANSVGREVVAK